MAFKGWREKSLQMAIFVARRPRQPRQLQPLGLKKDRNFRNKGQSTKQKLLSRPRKVLMLKNFEALL